MIKDMEDKTPQEYADWIIQKYSDITEIFGCNKVHVIPSAIFIAKNDVQNTIKAMSGMKLIFSDREIVLKYYKDVEQILIKEQDL